MFTIVVRRYRRRTRRAASKSKRAHYAAHKEAARTRIVTRVAELNGHYSFSYQRIAIRNQRSRWGSCSKKGNLNFNYVIAHLPPDLMDYVIVHELCHLAVFNHSRAFWALVAESLPHYRTLRSSLRQHCHLLR